MPKAFVATATSSDPAENARCTRARVSPGRPAWYASAFHPRPASRRASSSADRRVGAGRARPAEGLGEDGVHGPVAVARREDVPGAQGEVRPGEAADHLRRFGAEAETDDDLVAHDRRGRRGAGQHPRRPELLEESADLQVLRPEVVAPLADAMGLVDRDERRREARGEGAEARVGETLGGDVGELEGAGPQPREPLAHLVGRQRRREDRRRDAALLERAHLVVHQGDERRDHERRAGEERRGQLVDEALAAAGRRDEQQSPPLEELLDGLPLPGPEARVAETREARVEVERRHEA
jgi:hypothetical protein